MIKLQTNTFLTSAKQWPLLLIILLLPVVSSCDRDENEISDRFIPKVTIEAKLFVFGTQIDENGNLVLFVNGTDINGKPLTDTDLKQINVAVSDGTNTDTYTTVSPNLSIQSVVNNEKVLSLALITDYSGSMSDTELDNISDVYKIILSNLPSIYEIEVINFSDDPHLRLDWTEASNVTEINSGLERDDSINRNGTALHDSIGFALERNVSIIGGSVTEGDGLIERCRPAHMMVVFSDGHENWSSTYTDRDVLLSLLDQSETVAIMLGTESANQEELEIFAGDRGAIVSVYSTSGIADEMTNWAISLQHIAKVTLSAQTGFAGKTVSLALGQQETIVVRPTDSFCELAK